MTRLFLLLIQVGMFLNYCNGIPKKSIHVTPELAGKVWIALQKCQPETGIDTDTILLIYDGKYREDEQFKNFLFCSYKSTGFLGNDDFLDEDKAIRAFQREPLVEDGIRRCGSLRGRNPKESLFMFYKCFVNTTPVRITI